MAYLRNSVTFLRPDTRIKLNCHTIATTAALHLQVSSYCNFLAVSGVSQLIVV